MVKQIAKNILLLRGDVDVVESQAAKLWSSQEEFRSLRVNTDLSQPLRRAGTKKYLKHKGEFVVNPR